MANSELTNLFTNIANAIRSVDKTTEEIPAIEFADRIQNLNLIKSPYKIKFFISHDISGRKTIFEFEGRRGMTWKEWGESEFPTKGGAEFILNTRMGTYHPTLDIKKIGDGGCELFDYYLCDEIEHEEIYNCLGDGDPITEPISFNIVMINSMNNTPQTIALNVTDAWFVNWKILGLSSTYLTQQGYEFYDYGNDSYGLKKIGEEEPCGYLYNDQNAQNKINILTNINDGDTYYCINLRTMEIQADSLLINLRYIEGMTWRQLYESDFLAEAGYKAVFSSNKNMIILYNINDTPGEDMGLGEIKFWDEQNNTIFVSPDDIIEQDKSYRCDWEGILV